MSSASENVLLEIYAIQQLKYRYMRALDSHDWDLMEECFAEDAHVWYDNGHFKHEGRKNIIAFFRLYLDSFLYHTHIAVHPEIALTSPTTATGTWRMQDIVINVQPDPKIQQPGKIGSGGRLEGAGNYYDEYAKTGGKWVIKSSGYVRIYEYGERPGFKEVDHFDHAVDNYFKGEPARGLRKK